MTRSRRTGDVVRELRKHGLKSRRALDVFLDSRPEIQPQKIAGRFDWNDEAFEKVRAAFIAREKSRN